jgi:hypothetical protein
MCPLVGPGSARDLRGQGSPTVLPQTVYPETDARTASSKGEMPNYRHLPLIICDGYG